MLLIWWSVIPGVWTWKQDLRALQWSCKIRRQATGWAGCNTCLWTWLGRWWRKVSSQLCTCTCQYLKTLWSWWYFFVTMIRLQKRFIDIHEVMFNLVCTVNIERFSMHLTRFQIWKSEVFTLQLLKITWNYFRSHELLTLAPTTFA